MSLLSLPRACWLPLLLQRSTPPPKVKEALERWLEGEEQDGAVRALARWSSEYWVLQRLVARAHHYPVTPRLVEQLYQKAFPMERVADSPGLTPEAEAHLAHWAVAVLDRYVRGEPTLRQEPITVSTDTAEARGVLERLRRVPDDVVEALLERITSREEASHPERLPHASLAGLDEGGLGILTSVAVQMLTAIRPLPPGTLERVYPRLGDRTSLLFPLLEHPQANEALVLRVLGEGHRDTGLVVAILKHHPELLHSSVVRQALRRTSVPMALAETLLHEPASEQPALFRELVGASPAIALRLLEGPGASLLPRLAPADLLPLLSSPASDIRLRTLALSHHLQPAPGRPLASSGEVPLAPAPSPSPASPPVRR